MFQKVDNLTSIISSKHTLAEETKQNNKQTVRSIVQRSKQADNQSSYLGDLGRGTLCSFHILATFLRRYIFNQGRFSFIFVLRSSVFIFLDNEHVIIGVLDIDFINVLGFQSVLNFVSFRNFYLFFLFFVRFGWVLIDET